MASLSNQVHPKDKAILIVCRTPANKTAFLPIPYLPALTPMANSSRGHRAWQRGWREATAFGKYWTVPTFPGGRIKRYGNNFWLDPLNYVFGRKKECLSHLGV